MNEAAVDSIQAVEAEVALSPGMFEARVSREEDSPATVRGMRVGRVPFTEGLEPMERPMLPGYDSGVLCLLVMAFLILTYYARHYSTFLKTFRDDLFSTRNREKSFSVRTFSETGLQLSIVLLTCLSEGILVNAALSGSGARGGSMFGVIGMLAGIALGYYAWQLGVYWSVGAVFTDKSSARMWIKGFNSSQALAGMLLLVPALVVLFNPGTMPVVFPIGVICYFSARVLFICKGFRLFYDNFGSLVYFILYLCTLEFVPLVLLYRVVCFLEGMLLHL